MLFDDMSIEDKQRAKNDVRILFDTHKGQSMIILFEMLLDFTIRFDKNDFNYLNTDVDYSVRTSLRRLVAKGYISKVDRLKNRFLYEIPADMFPSVLEEFKHRLFSVLDYYEKNNMPILVDIPLILSVIDRLSFCSVRDILHYRVKKLLDLMKEVGSDTYVIERLNFWKDNFEL